MKLSEKIESREMNKNFAEVTLFSILNFFPFRLRNGISAEKL